MHHKHTVSTLDNLLLSDSFSTFKPQNIIHNSFNWLLQ